MTDHIAGNPATFPATVALFEDSDNPDASHLNLGTEDLADRTANLDARVTAEVAARIAAVNALYKIVDTKGSAFTTGGYNAQYISSLSGTAFNFGPDLALAFTGCNPGDVIECEVSFLQSADSGSEGTSFIRVDDGATSVDCLETERRTGTGGVVSGYDMTLRYVLSHVTAGGNATVRLRGRRLSGSGTFFVYVPMSMKARLLRPGS